MPLKLLELRHNPESHQWNTSLGACPPVQTGPKAHPSHFSTPGVEDLFDDCRGCTAGRLARQLTMPPCQIAWLHLSASFLQCELQSKLPRQFCDLCHPYRCPQTKCTSYSGDPPVFEPHNTLLLMVGLLKAKLSFVCMRSSTFIRQRHGRHCHNQPCTHKQISSSD